MKKILLSVALAASCAMAFAGEGQGNQSSAGDSQHQSQSTVATSGSVAGASNAGNSQNITFTAPADTSQTVKASTEVSGGTTSDVNYSGSQTIKNVPSVSGPNLVSSNDTCMGSASGSANGPGFGISLGKTYTDGNCVMLKNSRELWNMGMKAAALALMCTDSANKEALELTGYVCPTKKQDQAKPVAAASSEPTDPFIRSRMGLAALATAK